MFKSFKNYINDRLLLLKLEAIEFIGKVLAYGIVFVLLSIIAFSVWFFLMLGASFYIANHLLNGEIALSFIIISFLNLIFLLLLFLLRKILIRNLLSRFIRIVFNRKK